MRATGLSPAGCFLCGLSVMGAGDPEINSPKHFLRGLCGILGLLPSDGLRILCLLSWLLHDGDFVSPSCLHICRV